MRIRTGSWGCWFRTAKTGAGQTVISKRTAGAQFSYGLFVGTDNVLTVFLSPDGSAYSLCKGVSNPADDRWHFGVGTFDGTAARTYVDGVLEGTLSQAGTLFGSSGPLNIGADGGDGATALTSPHYGRVDEAFVTNDVLSDDQVRGLYCAKLAHGFTVTPTVVNLAVRRARKGGPLAPADFPTQPLRLHNFTAGSLNDQGSNGVALTNNGGAVSVVGADGAQGGAFNFVAASSQSLSATDAGLPSGLAARSYGAWFKTTMAAGATGCIVSWGTTVNSTDERLGVSNQQIFSTSGADFFAATFVSDGQWHHAVVTEDNAAGDGVRRKLYLDGRLVGGSTVLTAIASGGANHFRVGAQVDGTSPVTGQIDGAFVCDIALPQDANSKLYAKGSQTLPPSVKNAGDHVEEMDATNLYAVFDTLQTQHTIDLGVSG